MTLKLKEKKKVDLKVSIYLIKKKLKKQLNILMIRWMNMLKNFIQIKSKKTTTYHYSHCLFIATYYEKGSVKNFVALVKNSSFLVRITDMTILIEKEFIYGSSKRPNPTDYYRK